MKDFIPEILVGIVSAVLTYLGVMSKLRLDKKKLQADTQSQITGDFRGIIEELRKNIDYYKKEIDELRAEHEQIRTEYDQRIEDLENKLAHEKKARLEAEKIYEQRIEELNRRYFDEIVNGKDDEV